MSFQREKERETSGRFMETTRATTNFGSLSAVVILIFFLIHINYNVTSFTITLLEKSLLHTATGF